MRLRDLLAPWRHMDRIVHKKTTHCALCHAEVMVGHYEAHKDWHLVNSVGRPGKFAGHYPLEENSRADYLTGEETK